MSADFGPIRGIGGPDAPLVVVAGTIGSGKSTVCGWLAARGAAVIDADRIGHEILLDADVRRAVVEVFGAEILDDEGEIDRRRLGAIVFADADRLSVLNRLVHPPLVAELRRRIDILRGSRGVELIVVDAALWPVFPDPPDADLLLHVSAPEELRRRRIVERDGIPEAEAQLRIDRQRDLEASLGAADAVLENAAPPGEVRRRLFEVLDERLGTALVATDPGDAVPHED